MYIEGGSTRVQGRSWVRAIVERGLQIGFRGKEEPLQGEISRSREEEIGGT